MGEFQVIDAFSNKIPEVFADHSTVDVTVNGERFFLFNGGDLLSEEKGISPNSIWASVVDDEEKRTLIDLDNFLFSKS